MTLLEVLQKVDQLARSFHEKSKALDNLKTEYTRKLELINEYVKTLPNLEQGELNNESISDEVLLTQLKTQLVCQNCKLEVVLDNDFVMLPKKMIKVPKHIEDSDNEETIRQMQKLLVQASNSQAPDANSSDTNSSSLRDNKNKSKTLSKKICSYCNKRGHSRARCYTRLNNEKPINQPFNST